MTFFNICPHDEQYLNNHIGAIPLRVDSDNGVNVTPNIDISITDLNTVNNTLYHHFFNHGDGGVTVKIRILISKNDYLDNHIGEKEYKVLTVLKYLYSNLVPIMVRTDAIDVEDGLYLIVKNPSRQQNYTNYTVWELELITYTPSNLAKWENNNAGILKALKQAKKKAKQSSTKNSKLAKCNYKTLVYSKNKKVVKCVKYLQQILKQQKVYSGKIDGWYGKDTVTAVKKFQKKWNTKHTTRTINKNNGTLISVNTGKLITKTNNSNIKLPKKVKKLSGIGGTKTTTVKLNNINKVLKVTGKVDKATWKALCEV